MTRTLQATEHEEQKALVKWAKVTAPHRPELELLLAIPNAAKRSFRVAAMMKSEGLRAGVPDLFLPVPRGGHHGLWIELKAIKGRVQPSQEGWHQALRQQGYAVAVCWGWDVARQVIEDYLAMGNGDVR